MRNRAINVLIEMGMPADIKGFRYIVDAMEVFERCNAQKKMSYIYNEVALKNGATYSCVERAIRHAFGIVIVKGNMEIVGKYLTLQNTTNGNLLHVLYLRLSQEEVI